MNSLTLPLPTLTAALRSGELSLFVYLDELETHFAAREPDVLAFVPEDGRFARLRREAAELLDKYPDPDGRPPLFGVSVGVKDIFHVDGFVTQAGSRLPADVLQGDEAVSVTAVRQAGALIMGKTVTTEFAYFAPGPTRNPHNPAHTPGGSSSGSAAAVAASLCPFAFGTQTIGSINRPAAFCGVVGYKPSYDRISRENVIPLSWSLDHIGGFTRDVKGMQLVASVLVGDWESGDLGRKRPSLGIPEGPYLERASAEGLAHFRQTVQKLTDAGYTIKPIPVMADFDEIYARHNLIVAAEAARVHKDWYPQYKELYHWKTAELIERGLKISDEQLADAAAGREQLREALTAVMDTHNLDLWLSPAAPGSAPA
ncbi:MAG TPA: amidase, partial [Anaerolineae bacterium]|nr:amidase [Anaerolineae bacterium]